MFTLSGDQGEKLSASAQGLVGIMFVPVVVYQEEGKDNKFSICHDSGKDRYFLLVGERVYHELNYPYTGEFEQVMSKLKELKASEYLVIIPQPEEK